MLSDGDVIKIGAQTSILVKFEGNVVENEVSSVGIRKNVRRRGKDKSMGSDLGVIDELGLGDKVDEEKNDGVAEIEVIQQVNDTELKNLNTEENKDLGVNDVKELPGVRTRRTRNSRKEGDTIEAAIDLSVIEGRKPRGRKKEVVETIPEETEKEEEKVAEELNSGKKDGAVELGSTSGVKENNDVNTLKGKMLADLDTMRVGEWFDFLEVHLRQQIVEETEAKIAEMRQTAERFHEFMVQQRKLKG